MNIKIAIIDIIGIPYDGTTVSKQALGGSESAVCLMSKELHNQGFDVSVFNSCDDNDAKPGIYEGVKYYQLSELINNWQFDIVISSRTVIPFVDPADYNKLNDQRSTYFVEFNLYERIIKHAKMRILWMHDTFCLGDLLIEPLVVQNRITNIFTLSDFHLTYVANCDHGGKRNFEVLKDKFFSTRNGVRLYDKETDLSIKDKNTFVYNAAVHKGMAPLVEQIWPRVKSYIPQAKLIVIGGFYKFKDSLPDEQEIIWRRLSTAPQNDALDITFTGIITQQEISKILQKSNFMLYPAAFPETFGISTLESLCYNTPVITCRFGALEEIALENACYLVDYAIQPNSLFPNIDADLQIEKFVAMTVAAYNDDYLHQQKQNYCDIVKDVAGWDSVALQWKQFFYKELGYHLPLTDFVNVSRVNTKVSKIWNKRYHNSVELNYYSSSKQNKIVVISPFYNSEDYLKEHILSVSSQDYENYEHILINDCSTDNSVQVIIDVLEQLPNEIQKKYKLINNGENIGAVHNQVDAIRSLSNDAYVMLLDGDDFLMNDNSIFKMYNDLYNQGFEFTYGSCWSMADNIPLIAQDYPTTVKDNKSYRSHHFNWIIPYTHLRSFKSSLFDNINDSSFKDPDNNWYKAGGDGSLFYAVIEQADSSKIKAVKDIVVKYNDINPLNDYKINAEEQNINARNIIQMEQQSKKKILIAIPTARYIEPETFKSVYDLEIPDGYETVFQYFYGYQVDQIRNLIADWTINGYDYLFSIDSDISFESDTLMKMLNHNVDIISGLYIQRIPGTHQIEIYKHNERGGYTNIRYEEIKDKGLVKIAGCGMGCTLIKAEVMKEIEYPQFVYHSAIDHAHTISEDIDFCRKVNEKGFQIYTDTSIKCTHRGSSDYVIDDTIPAMTTEIDLPSIIDEVLIPKNEYFKYLFSQKNINPSTIYDIGSGPLDWATEATQIWPNSTYVVFDALSDFEELYKTKNLLFHIGALSNETGRPVEFTKNNENLQDSGYYNVSTNSEFYTSVTIDAVTRLKQFPIPDVLKINTCGSELDILKGTVDLLPSVTSIFLTSYYQDDNFYTLPNAQEIFEFMKLYNFKLLEEFDKNSSYTNYHFVKIS